MTSAKIERQEEILKAIREGSATNDERAELYELVKKFCWGVAYKYQAKLRCPDEISDLLQESYFAVQKAAETFDPEDGKTFIGWLVYYLHRACAAYVAAQDGRGLNREQLKSKIARFEGDYLSLFGSGPSDAAICYKFEITPDKLEALRAERSSMLSLDEVDENGLSLLDRIDQSKARDGGSLEDEVIDKLAMEEAGAKLREYIGELRWDEQEAIKLYYFSNMTDRDCASRMNITEESFRALRHKALYKLRTA